VEPGRKQGPWLPGREPGDGAGFVFLYGALVRLTECVLGDLPQPWSAATDPVAREHAVEQQRVRSDLEQLRARRRFWHARASGPDLA
jgi:hypothetical protein